MPNDTCVAGDSLLCGSYAYSLPSNHYNSGHLSHTSLNGCLGRHEHVSSKHTLQKYLFILATRLRYVLQKCAFFKALCHID